MSNDFEKMTDNILLDERGAIPTSIKQLSISLDSDDTIPRTGGGTVPPPDGN